MLARIIVVVHVGGLLASAASALVGVAAPADRSWIAAGLLCYGCWAGSMAVAVRQRGLSTSMMTVGVFITTVLCIGQRVLVTPPALAGGANWVGMLGTLAIVTASLAWRLPVSLTVGAVICVCYAVGARLAGAPEGGVFQLTAFAVQAVTTGSFMLLVRRAGDFADRTLDDLHRVQERAQIEREMREQQRADFRRLHDTVLATLTEIGSGSIAATSPRLRARAASDIRVLLEPTDGHVSGAGRPLCVDDVLRRVLRSFPGTRTNGTSTGWMVPADVADAIADAVAEALRNIRRHAAGASATVTVAGTHTGGSVVVADRGPGFHPDQVAPHRIGVTESIIGRLASVGGSAAVESRPRHGTTVTIRWPADD